MTTWLDVAYDLSADSFALSRWTNFQVTPSPMVTIVPGIGIEATAEGMGKIVRTTRSPRYIGLPNWAELVEVGAWR